MSLDPNAGKRRGTGRHMLTQCLALVVGVMTLIALTPSIASANYYKDLLIDWHGGTTKQGIVRFQKYGDTTCMSMGDQTFKPGGPQTDLIRYEVENTGTCVHTHSKGGWRVYYDQPGRRPGQVYVDVTLDQVAPRIFNTICTPLYSQFSQCNDGSSRIALAFYENNCFKQWIKTSGYIDGYSGGIRCGAEIDDVLKWATATEALRVRGCKDNSRFTQSHGGPYKGEWECNRTGSVVSFKFLKDEAVRFDYNITSG
jgi:hypothetical protein